MPFRIINPVLILILIKRYFSNGIIYIYIEREQIFRAIISFKKFVCRSQSCSKFGKYYLCLLIAQVVR